MQDIITAWPMLIPFGVLFVLASVLVFALLILLEKPSAADMALDHWKSRARRILLGTLRRHRFDLVFGICLAAAVTFISGLLLSLGSDASHNLKSIIFLLQIAPFYLADMLTGNTHENGSGTMFVFWVLVFMQWLIVGFTFSTLIRTKK
ncbi:MAG: hypothetical protein WCH99_22720 [Verrucomicrobiota bacterium]